MKFMRQAVVVLCALIGGLGGISTALAADLPTLGEGKEKSALGAKDLVLRGDAKCTRCHDETDSPKLLSIGKTKHGATADGRTPTCTSCHGKSEAHMVNVPAGQPQPKPDRVFSKNSATPVVARNDACLTCHENGLRMHWKGSQHEIENLACASCHTIHAGKDPVLVKQTQPEVCFNCHKEKRAEILLPSSHPIRDGKVACSDCHNPHGSTGPKMLVKGTVNETCYTCHAEKRGPFLWEHAPVREDCTICHKPHGSVHASLLKQRGPWLCQQCHLVQYHPSTAYSGTGLPGAAPAQQLLGKNCLNCHSQVHGSNHPSGVRKTR
ncbi:MAG: DmsE family decaheme c-type cytochrome [Sulfuricaulis sp.]|nr:DmsE family decaheme c-type cytochrome [Sulfuricaulis sp.]